MSAYPELLQQVRSALAGGEQTPTVELQDLYRQCFGGTCYRRPRIIYKLQSFLNKWSTEEEQSTISVESPSTSPSLMAVSENYRFKSGFKKKPALVHTPVTRHITPTNLQDDDVPVLRAAGLGHFIEVIPGREKEAEEALKPKTPAPAELPSLNVNKPELQAIYERELGAKPDDDLKVEDLKEAILKHRSDNK